MTVTELWGAIRDGGVPFILFVIIVGNFLEYWVPGYLYKQVCKERDEWKRLALKTTSLGEVASERAERG